MSEFSDKFGVIYEQSESGEISLAEYQKQIPAITREHVEALEGSPGEDVWDFIGMPVLLLRTIGRRSGKEHKVALPYWTDPADRRIVVGSFSGLPNHPAWYLNLTDGDANPEVLVADRNHRYWAEPRELEGDDYAATWTALMEARPHGMVYAHHQSRTDRRLPLVHLAEVRPA